MRFVAGPCCDRFGPRKTFAGCLLIGAIPTFLAGTAYTAGELYALRFFIGILGGSFVPCQVWTTGFYDKNVVGTANSLTAGFGNSGGGITYFVMPAVYDSLVGEGLTRHVAWRVAFIVPGILITSVALALLLLCEDSPTGKWSERPRGPEPHVGHNPTQDGKIVDQVEADNQKTSGTSTPRLDSEDKEKQQDELDRVDTAQGEVIEKPTARGIAKICASPQTLIVGATYFCTFGAELAINSILGTYYQQNFKGLNLGLQTASNWAAMFGLMNVVFRPLGGVVSDLAYGATKSPWAKKALMHSYALIAGAFLVAIGVTDPHNLATLVCLVGVGFAFFLEGANGLVFSLVPHIYSHSNGVVSGVTGASGNLGGIIFSIVFRYNGKDYGKSIWIIGVIIMAVQVAICWIRPVPKGQMGAR